MAAKKRRPPEPVEPVEMNGVRYEAPMEGEVDGTWYLGGVVMATDAASAAALWSVRVVGPTDDPDMEGDKNTRFITQLEPHPPVLRVHVDDGSVWDLDPVSRTAAEVAAG